MCQFSCNWPKYRDRFRRQYPAIIKKISILTGKYPNARSISTFKVSLNLITLEIYLICVPYKHKWSKLLVHLVKRKWNDNFRKHEKHVHVPKDWRDVWQNVSFLSQNFKMYVKKWKSNFIVFQIYLYISKLPLFSTSIHYSP